MQLLRSNGLPSFKIDASNNAFRTANYDGVLMYIFRQLRKDYCCYVCILVTYSQLTARCLPVNECMVFLLKLTVTPLGFLVLVLLWLDLLFVSSLSVSIPPSFPNPLLLGGLSTHHWIQWWWHHCCFLIRDIPSEGLQYAHMHLFPVCPHKTVTGLVILRLPPSFVLRFVFSLCRIIWGGGYAWL